MTYREIKLFFETVKEMRRLQKEYFQTKNLAVLEQSKKTEKLVDTMVRTLNPDERSLFDD